MDDYLFSYAAPTDPAVKRKLIRLVERATGQPALKRLYIDNQRHPRPSESFWAAAFGNPVTITEIRAARDLLARITRASRSQPSTLTDAVESASKRPASGSRPSQRAASARSIWPWLNRATSPAASRHR